MKKKLSLSTDPFFGMLPRAFFFLPEGQSFLTQKLTTGGVYVLYRDDIPFYIGRTDKPLLKRIRFHAKNPNSRYYNFWNYFSVFLVDARAERITLEAKLIALMPSANSANPYVFKEKFKAPIKRVLNELQEARLTVSSHTGRPSRR